MQNCVINVVNANSGFYSFLAFHILSWLGVQKEVLMKVFQKGKVQIVFESPKSCSSSEKTCLFSFSGPFIFFLAFLCECLVFCLGANKQVEAFNLLCDTHDSHVNLLVFVAYDSVPLSNLLQIDKNLCRGIFHKPG